MKLKVPRLGLMLTLAGFVLVGAVFAPFVPRIYRLVQAASSIQHSERNALKVLQSEPLTFLVTDRISSQIVVESNDSNLFLGKKEGYLIAKANMYYGIDLAKLSEADLIRTNDVLIVHLPPPEELDFAVDLESMRYLSKRSGLMVIADWVTNSDQREALRSQFKTAAIEYMTEENLIPSKQKIILRLAGQSDMLSEYIGIKVVFE